ncbi:hypothetical protein [Nostoc sp.]|uniref:hypothetical protein n=1 Tax=Nostoc sp. TaxID=1180 RepID=UPI002FF7819E
MKSLNYSRIQVFEPYLSSGHSIAHECQLNVKTSLEPAFKRLSRSQSPTGNAYGGLPPQDLRQSRN